jgi:transposase
MNDFEPEAIDLGRRTTFSLQATPFASCGATHHMSCSKLGDEPPAKKHASAQTQLVAIRSIARSGDFKSVAEDHSVRVKTIKKWVKRYNDTGHVGRAPPGGPLALREPAPSCKLDDDVLATFVTILEDDPVLFYYEVRDLLHLRTGVLVPEASLS